MTTETPRGGVKSLLLVLTVLFILIIPVCASDINFTPQFNTTEDVVHYNVTSHIDQSNTTPIEIWASSALLGLILFCLTMKTRKESAELEGDAILSVLAWIPIGYTAYTSFAVDRITAYGVTGTLNNYVLMENHVIYHFDVIGVLYVIFFFAAIINTYRILTLHKALILQNEQSRQEAHGKFNT
ncbi:MAG: hypothetical protein PHX61_02300 [Alphaproteobacteria bacterium]|nr:hypothetical protein [Alphaproteobacteria bacterium]